MQHVSMQYSACFNLKTLILDWLLQGLKSGILFSFSLPVFHESETASLTFSDDIFMLLKLTQTSK